MLTISPSTVQMLACHKKFQTLAVNHQYPSTQKRSPVLRFAIALHEVLRLAYDPAQGKELPRISQLPLYLRAAFMQQAYREEVERETDMARAQQMTHPYMECDKEAAFTTGVECKGKYSINIGGEATYEVSARLDRIIEMPSGVCIARDYTTGTKTLSVEQVWCNLVILRLLRPGFADYQLQVDTLNNENIVDRVVYPSRHLKGIVTIINAQVLAFEQVSEYLPTEGEQCLYCPLAASCVPQLPSISADELDWS